MLPMILLMMADILKSFCHATPLSTFILPSVMLLDCRISNKMKEKKISVPGSEIFCLRMHEPLAVIWKMFECFACMIQNCQSIEVTSRCLCAWVSVYPISLPLQEKISSEVEASQPGHPFIHKISILHLAPHTSLTLLHAHCLPISSVCSLSLMLCDFFTF